MCPLLRILFLYLLNLSSLTGINIRILIIISFCGYSSRIWWKVMCKFKKYKIHLESLSPLLLYTMDLNSKIQENPIKNN